MMDGQHVIYYPYLTDVGKNNETLESKRLSFYLYDCNSRMGDLSVEVHECMKVSQENSSEF